MGGANAARHRAVGRRSTFQQLGDHLWLGIFSTGQCQNRHLQGWSGFIDVCSVLHQDLHICSAAAICQNWNAFGYRVCVSASLQECFQHPWAAPAVHHHHVQGRQSSNDSHLRHGFQLGRIHLTLRLHQGLHQLNVSGQGSAQQRPHGALLLLRKLQGFESEVLDEFAHAATHQGLARQRLASGQEVSVQVPVFAHLEPE
mmetsp:Transcript_54457/g.119193  ORF Transcript_54457/g.119193 Transcript_54457/m.119193 type:complete len:200 (+) Transcript_54457:482-1081(+)